MQDRILVALKLIMSVDSPPASFDFPRILKFAEQGVGSDCCFICMISGNLGTPVKVLEQHHIAGKPNFPDTISVCKACHMVLTDYQKVWLTTGRDDRSQLACYFYGWADVFDLIFKRSGVSYYDRLARRFRSEGFYVRNHSREDTR